MTVDTQNIDEVYKLIAARRHVRDACAVCRGTGVRMYASGATWRGGMGTTCHAPDVCDACWGSGDRYRHGVNLRQLRDEEEQRIRERAVSLLAEVAGAGMGLTLAVAKIADALDALAKAQDRRGATPVPHLAAMATSLARTLRKAAKVGGKDGSS